MLPPKARFANVDAWLKRSHREKATVLVIVKTSAMAGKNTRQRISPVESDS